MATQCPALTDVLALLHTMAERVRAENLPHPHTLRQRAHELHRAYLGRFMDNPRTVSNDQFIDIFIRAVAALHAHCGEDR